MMGNQGAPASPVATGTIIPCGTVVPSFK
jgi:hypothetical protein